MIYYFYGYFEFNRACATLLVIFNFAAIPTAEVTYMIRFLVYLNDTIVNFPPTILGVKISLDF